MDRFYEIDVGGATYRSKDPIKNFRFSVNLQRVSPAALGFLTSRPGTTGAGDENQAALSISATSVNEFGQTVLESEDLNAQWQQKFFSAREFEFFGNSPVAGSVEDYKYHSNVDKLKKGGGRPNHRIFTYLDNDSFAPMGEEFIAITTSMDEKPTSLTTRMSELRRRRPPGGGGNALSAKLKKGQGAKGLNIVVKKPSDEFRQNNHIVNTPVHKMLVMADLSPEGQLGNSLYEKRLCEIEYDENGVLHITPDFTPGRLPYRIESGLSRDIWLCTIKSTSTTMSRLEIQREAKILKQLYTKHQTYLLNLVGKDFEEVKSGVLRLVTNGEIMSAQSFEYDDLHIEYFLDIPRNWSSNPGVMTSGCTQTCRTTLHNNIEVAHYSHPFSYDSYLVYNREDIEDSAPEWPKLYLQVVSSDTWGRRRTEGYGFVTLPSDPGFHKVKVDCWRPMGNAGQQAAICELRRFFIGGSSELEDPTYVGIPSTFEGSKVLSKYGVRTESTGSVTIRFNCIIQQEPSVTKTDVVTNHVQKRKQQTALQLAKGNAANEAVHGVMDAFLRARQRMQLARESVPEHIRKTADERSKEPLGRADHERSEHINKVLAGEAVWRERDEEETSA